MSRDREDEIISSYEKNAQAWTNAIRAQTVRTRREATDEAIRRAVLAQSPKSLLDVGCGEGWLVRDFFRKGLERVLGVDGSLELVKKAQEGGEGEFRCVSYDGLGELGSTEEPFDVIVCNFSLIGEESVSQLFEGISHVMHAESSLIIQTLHPRAALQAPPYRSGWREGSWEGFGKEFSDPHPWFFRTLTDWIALFSRANLFLSALAEPSLGEEELPVSIVFTCKLRG